jgi:hypothetical protein
MSNRLIKKKIECLPKKFNISKNIYHEILAYKKKFSKKKYFNFEFFCHLFLCFLSTITILKCKILRINVCNYIISLKGSDGEIDFRSKYIVNNLDLRKCVNFVRSVNFINSIKFYIKQPNVVFFLSIEYFGALISYPFSKNDFDNFHSQNLNTKKIVKKIFNFLFIKKFISIDDQRVIVLFLEICEELNIKTIGYMHYRFADIFPGIKQNAFDVFFVWSDYFKKKLIQINNKYQSKEIIITGVNKKIYKKNKNKITALFVLDAETKFTLLSNLLLVLKKNKISIAVKFKPSSNVNNDKWVIFLRNNSILYFEKETFSEIRNQYSISYFVAYSSTALYEAYLYDAESIIIKNNSKIAKEIINEKIIKSIDNKSNDIIKFLKKNSNKDNFLFIKKKIWGTTVYNRHKIIRNLIL